MLCQFDDDLLGGSIEVCDAKATNLPRLGWFRFGIVTVANENPT
jgi:hypothetical protein